MHAYTHLYARIRRLSAQLFILLSSVAPSVYARIRRLAPTKFRHVELSRPAYIFLTNQRWYPGSFYWESMPAWLTEPSTRTRPSWPLLKRIYMTTRSDFKDHEKMRGRELGRSWATTVRLIIVRYIFKRLEYSPVMLFKVCEEYMSPNNKKKLKGWRKCDHIFLCPFG